MLTVRIQRHLLVIGLVLMACLIGGGQTQPAGAQGSNNTLDAADGDPADAVFVDNEGNVGIGTQNPLYRLHVTGGPGFQEIVVSDNTQAGIVVKSKDKSLFLYNNSRFFALNAHDYEQELPLPLALNYTGGNVGVGTTDPQYKLHVTGGASWEKIVTSDSDEAGISVKNGTKSLFLYNNGAMFKLDAYEYGSDQPLPLLLNQSGGNVGVGNVLNPQSKLHVDGTTTTKVLQITGGSDLAEPFAVNDSTGDDVAAIEPGTVVVLDADNSGELRVAQRAYDRGVAGVISGAGDIQPGLIMQQEAAATVDGEMHPVALTGKVYVNAVGPIQVSDLLTTSDVPGHAMAATDREQAFGATLGKAMTALDAEETGLVLVLVALQ